MNIRPSFKYRFANSLRGSEAFFGIFALVLTFIILLSTYYNSNGSDSEVSFSAYEVAACINVFVFGICTVREDLRLGIQNGVSRRSVYVATLLSSVLITVILAVAGDLLTIAAQALTRGTPNADVQSLYQMMFAHDVVWLSAPIGMHLESILFTFTLLICANFVGSFISLVFFRLNKIWTIIVAVSVPILLFWILPITMASFDVDLSPYIQRIEFTPALISGFYALCAVVAALLNRLLMLRVPIKAATK